MGEEKERKHMGCWWGWEKESLPPRYLKATQTPCWDWTVLPLDAASFSGSNDEMCKGLIVRDLT